MQTVLREEAEALGFSPDYSNPLTSKVKHFICVNNGVIEDVVGGMTLTVGAGVSILGDAMVYNGVSADAYVYGNMTQAFPKITVITNTKLTNASKDHAIIHIGSNTLIFWADTNSGQLRSASHSGNTVYSTVGSIPVDESVKLAFTANQEADITEHYINDSVSEFPLNGTWDIVSTLAFGSHNGVGGKNSDGVYSYFIVSDEVLTQEEIKELQENPYSIFNHSNQNEDMTNIYGLTDPNRSGYIRLPKPATRGWHRFTCEFFLNALPDDNGNRFLLASGIAEGGSELSQFGLAVRNSSLYFFLRSADGVSKNYTLNGVCLGYNKVVFEHHLTTAASFNIYLENETGTYSVEDYFGSANFWQTSWDEITELFIGAIRNSGGFQYNFIKGVIVNFSYAYRDTPSDFNLVYDFNDPNTDYNFINLANGTNDITLVNIPSINSYLNEDGAFHLGRTAIQIPKPTDRQQFKVALNAKCTAATPSSLFIFGTGSDESNYPNFQAHIEPNNSRLRINHKLPTANGGDTTNYTQYIPFKEGFTFPDDGLYHDIAFTWHPWTGSHKIDFYVDGVNYIDYDDSLITAQVMTTNEWANFSVFYVNAYYDVYNTNSISNPSTGNGDDWFIKTLDITYSGSHIRSIDFSTFNGQYVYDSIKQTWDETILVELNNSGVTKAIQALHYDIGPTGHFVSFVDARDTVSDIDYARAVLDIEDGEYTHSAVSLSNGRWHNYQPIVKAKNKGQVTLAALDFFIVRGNWQGINFKSSDPATHTTSFLIYNDPSGSTDGPAVFTDCTFVAEDDLQCIQYNTVGSGITVKAEYKRCLFVTGENAGNLCVDLGSKNSNDYVYADLDQCVCISRKPTSGTTALVRSNRDKDRATVTNTLFYAASSNPPAMSDDSGNNRVGGYNNIYNRLLGETVNGQESVDMTNFFKDLANGDFQLTETAQAVLEGAGGGGVNIAEWLWEVGQLIEDYSGDLFLAINVAINSSGQKETSQDLVFDVQVNIVPEGQKENSGDNSVNYGFLVTSTGQKESSSDAELNFSVSPINPTGQKESYSNSAVTFNVTSSTTALKEGSGGSSLSFTFEITSTGEKDSVGEVLDRVGNAELDYSVVISTTGEKDLSSDIELSFPVTVSPTALKEASGSAELSSLVTVQGTGQKEISEGLSLEFSLGFTSTGQKEILDDLELQYGVDLTSSGVKSIESALALGMQVEIDSDGEKIAIGDSEVLINYIIEALGYDDSTAVVKVVYDIALTDITNRQSVKAISNRQSISLKDSKMTIKL